MSEPAKKKPRSAAVALNRKARYNYFIEEEIEAGMMLLGTEVKSLRAGRVSLDESYAAERAGELWMMNAMIYEYQGGNRNNHEPRRPRKLLVHKRDLKKLIGKLRTKGISLIPLKIYFNDRGIAKVRLGLGKGKHEYEKREVIKKREWDREKTAMLKNRR